MNQVTPNEQASYPRGSAPEVANPEGSFAVAVRWDMTPNEVTNYARYGLVAGSPHLGNLPVEHGYFAAQSPGVRFIVDERLTLRDTAYQPAVRMEARRPEQLVASSDMDRLGTHAMTRADSRAGALPLVDVHLQALREAFPQANFQSMSDYFLGDDQGETFRKIVSTLVANGFGDFSRRVDAEGNVHAISENVGTALRNYGLFRDGNKDTDRQGLLLPTTYTVLLMGVLDILRTGYASVYHLSPRHMTHFVPKMAETLSAMYNALRQDVTFHDRLPAQLRFNLIPTRGLRLATLAQDASDLDQVWTTYQEWRASVGEQEQKGGRGWQARAAMSKLPVSAALHSRPALFAPPLTLDTTQYDVLAARRQGEEYGYYLPEPLTKTTMRGLAQRISTLRKLR